MDCNDSAMAGKRQVRGVCDDGNGDSPLAVADANGYEAASYSGGYAESYYDGSLDSQLFLDSGDSSVISFSYVAYTGDEVSGTFPNCSQVPLDTNFVINGFTMYVDSEVNQGSLICPDGTEFDLDPEASGVTITSPTETGFDGLTVDASAYYQITPACLLAIITALVLSLALVALAAAAVGVLCRVPVPGVCRAAQAAVFAGASIAIQGLWDWARGVCRA